MSQNFFMEDSDGDSILVSDSDGDVLTVSVVDAEADMGVTVCLSVDDVSKLVGLMTDFLWSQSKAAP